MGQPLSRAALVDLVERAASLEDCLDGAFEPAQAGDGARAEERLTRWRRLAARGDVALFARRVAWDGLELEQVRGVLSGVRLKPGAPLPRWTDTLQAVLEVASPDLLAGEHGCLLADDPIPFQEIFLPFVRVAQTRLAERHGQRLSLLSPRAHDALARRLVVRLATIAMPALYLAFDIRRRRQSSSLDMWLLRLRPEPPTKIYGDFVVEMLTGRLAPLFLEYPVLARLAATVTDQWVEATGEFLERLEGDREAIRGAFGLPGDPGQVDHIGGEFSDAHQGGRSVIAVTFTSGLRLVYKPKDLGLEEAFFRVVDWVNCRGLSLPLRVVRVLPRGPYGWVEFVEHLPCEDAAAVTRYYRRAGILLGLLYVLGENDCHEENLIACGDQPVLIDGETLLRPEAVPLEPRGEGFGAATLAEALMLRSVLAVGLLPAWMTRDERSIDISALGAIEPQWSLDPVPQCDHVNTDLMAVVHERVLLELNKNVVRIGGVVQSPWDHVEDLVAGLEEMHALLLREREALLAPGGPLEALRDRPVRFIVRSTSIYARCMARAREPESLRHGVDHSIELDVLARPLLDQPTPHHLWPVFRWERRAMAQEDVPFFTVRSDRDDLVLPDGTAVAGCLAGAPWDTLRARLAALGEADEHRQIAFTRAAMTARFGRPAGEAWDAAPAAASSVSVLSPQELVATAQRIAVDLAHQAIRGRDGSVAWIGMGYLPESGRLSLEPIGFGLYNGVAGVAIFFAALHAITGEHRYGDLAVDALRPVRHALLEWPQRLAAGLGLGGADGIDSVAYGLLITGQLLQDEALIALARTAARQITPELVAADRHLDVVLGCAGTLLTLLALIEEVGDDDLLDRAVACGHHLVEHRSPTSQGPRAWHDVQGVALAGFSHGASGIAYALLRLYHRTGEARFREAALEGLAYEAAIFSPEASNWPDLDARDETASRWRTAWCHGATGVGFARLGVFAVVDAPDLRRDLDVAIRTTLAAEHTVDQLCCGLAGRAEFLLTAGQRLGRPDLVDAARRLISEVAARVDRGDVRLMAHLPPGIHIPGLFQGTAGIGYTMLRQAFPERLPAVLLWEGSPTAQ
ncbi:MAG: type 2 lantipeptide synthetase LanM [Armatimonadetes bacterium]|nr:type 2 lantipeptide synthetase LanM [Armatimonadota bacterium]